MVTDQMLFSAAAERNADAIGRVLEALLPEHGDVLEIASGSGQHAIAMAARFPGLRWHPSDPDPRARASIAARIAAAAVGNCEPARALDVLAAWPPLQVDAVVVVNLLHISPWPATVAVCRGAAGILKPGAPLYVYGPFRRNGAHTSDGNRRFDAALRAENPLWGIRDAEAVVASAEQCELSFDSLIEMPANNLSLVFRRPAG
ncbi:MAG: DUF938 domain-containing protein [Pseudomonadales bacterium]